MKLFVGNLDYNVTEDTLRSAFSQHGAVQSVAIVTDRFTGQPRGFGFVEMSDADATEAIKALDGSMLGNRPIKVNEARAKEEGGGRFGGGGGRPGGGGGRGPGGGGGRGGQRGGGRDRGQRW